MPENKGRCKDPENCDRLAYCKGLCAKHYHRQYKKTYDPGKCSQKNCDKSQSGGGLCAMHRYRLKMGLEMNAPIQETAPVGLSRICLRENCDNKVIGRTTRLYCSKFCQSKNWRTVNNIKVNLVTLKRKAKVRGIEATLTNDEWDSILELWNYQCVYCGDPWEQIDHFVPLCSGGTHTSDNVLPACAHCNQKKNRKEILEFIGCGYNG